MVTKEAEGNWEIHTEQSIRSMQNILGNYVKAMAKGLRGALTLMKASNRQLILRCQRKFITGDLEPCSVSHSIM